MPRHCQEMGRDKVISAQKTYEGFFKGLGRGPAAHDWLASWENAGRMTLSLLERDLIGPSSLLLDAGIVATP